MTHLGRDGRVCRIGGCTGRVEIFCELCEESLGYAPQGGLAEASTRWDRTVAHWPECQGPRENQ